MSLRSRALGQRRCSIKISCLRNEWINCKRMNIGQEKTNTNKIQAADYSGSFPEAPEITGAEALT